MPYSTRTAAGIAGAARACSRALAVSIAALLAAAAGAPRAHAMCCPFPCDDCWITSNMQLNYVVMDRVNDRVDLIPNIRFAGVSEDFAIVVPTPSLPAFSLAPERIWDEAALLTAPAASRSSGDAFGCGQNTVALSDAGAETQGDGVTVHGQVTMGGMTATIVSSDSPGALVRWLDDNGFAISTTDSTRFAPYVARSWFFTAMRPDTATVMPDNGWDADVMPVRVSYSAPELEVPLPIITINQGPQLLMQFYVLDDTKTELPGFTTLYANALTESEVDAIRGRYPALEGLVAPGRVLTKLRATNLPDQTAGASIYLRRAPDNGEVRQVTMREIPGELGLFAAAVFIARPIRRRGRRHGDASARGRGR